MVKKIDFLIFLKINKLFSKVIMEQFIKQHPQLILKNISKSK
jgi:hypothetical protein